jgi:hypothetical protein
LSNPFLNLDSPGTVGAPTRLYGLLQQIEPSPDFVFLQFDAIDADWFDANAPNLEGKWPDLDVRVRFFDDAPLYALETESLFAQIAPVVYGIVESGNPGLPLVQAAFESIWFEIELTAGPGTPAMLYRNLFGPGAKQNLKSIRPASAKALQLLQVTDPLGPVPDASDADVLKILSGVAAPDFVSVYNVGQGNMNALCDNAGKPQLYYDIGGGVLGNAKTFPAGFNDACFSTPPPIVLSHWDMDHWSSARRRFTQALSRTWIAPRQSPLGKAHGALITSILASGRLLIWSPPSGSIRSGRLELVVCTGPGRNHSGLALYVSGPAGQDEVLLPGDAAYVYVPNALTAKLHALVAAHHGGNLVKPGIPTSAGAAHSRLAYSYGTGNKYKHPRPMARSDHDGAGWEDKIANPSRSRNLVRETPIGHLSIHWTMPARLPVVHCGSCPTPPCNLQIAQT